MYEAITIFLQRIGHIFKERPRSERRRVADRHLFFFPILKITHRGVSRGLMCLLEPLIDGGARVVGALSTPLT